MLEPERYRVQRNLLIETLNDEWKDRKDVYVGGGLPLYFTERQLREGHPAGPDVFVVTNTQRGERKAWVVWKEGGLRPDVVVDLTSAPRDETDRDEKMRLYDALRVDAYCIYEPGTERVEIVHRVDGRYEPLSSDASGHLDAAPIGMKSGLCSGTHQGLDGPWLRWFRPDGTVVPTGAERAAAAEARAAALEAELAALRGRST